VADICIWAPGQENVAGILTACKGASKWNFENLGHREGAFSSGIVQVFVWAPGQEKWGTSRCLAEYWSGNFANLAKKVRISALIKFAKFNF
jgi:hypothetical protein